MGSSFRTTCVAAMAAACLVCVVPAAAAPAQWTVGSGGNGNYYDYVPGYLTWQQARVAAEALAFQGLSGRLVTVNSAAEKDFINGAVSNAQGWLGGFQDTAAPGFSEPSGGWRWITGEPWSYTNWFPGFPDEFNNAQQNFLRCGDALWDDIQNDPGAGSVGGYFVEYVPEPAVAAPLALVAVAVRRRRSTAA